MVIMKKINIARLLQQAFEDFRKNDPLRMAGATAFFTTFALPAVLLILIQVFGLVLGPRFMSRQLFENLGEVFGRNTAAELHKTLFNVRLLIRHGWAAFFGFLFLIFVATTLLKVVKDSLNQLWNIRTTAHPGIRYNLLTRAKSFIVILLGGLLFLMVLLAEGGIDFLQQHTNNQTAGTNPVFRMAVRQCLSFLLITIWFSLLFKFLPDGRPSWKTVITGGAFTSFFFNLGKLLLQWLLSYSNMQTIYGASTSSVLLLLFVFYSSFIFYYGACFTRVWTEFNKKTIPPGEHAENYEWSQVKKPRAAS
jgi:membrane protein